MRLLILFAAVALVSCEVASSPRDSVLDPQTKPSTLECRKECNSWRHYALRMERHRHRDQIRRCTTQACIDGENQEHQMLLDEIQLDTQTCLYYCEHGQGGGVGGQ